MTAARVRRLLVAAIVAALAVAAWLLDVPLLAIAVAVAMGVGAIAAFASRRRRRAARSERAGAP